MNNLKKRLEEENTLCFGFKRVLKSGLFQFRYSRIHTKQRVSLQSTVLIFHITRFCSRLHRHVTNIRGIRGCHELCTRLIALHGVDYSEALTAEPCLCVTAVNELMKVE